jgi:hypothetical protein
VRPERARIDLARSVAIPPTVFEQYRSGGRIFGQPNLFLSKPVVTFNTMSEEIQMPNGDFLRNYPDVTRVEVITEEGRKFVRYECSNVQVSLQDEGQTIKVFLFSTYD